MNSGKVAISLVAAAAIGAVLGILFAPSKGAALRRKIRRMGEKEADVLKDKFSDFAENMSQNFEKVKGTVVDYANQTINKNQEKVKTAENN
ncbi:MAG: YtxH domain-containing protein [Paludibacter sp.]|nr:YtxH domain-containing protein [Paludibacter sp.]